MQQRRRPKKSHCECHEQEGPPASAEGAGPADAAPDYKVEEMTFEMDDEAIPAYQAPNSDDDEEGEDPGPSNGEAKSGAGALREC